MRRERSHEGCSALDDPVLPEGHLPYPSPCCRFIPTCSAYALEAIEKYGAWKGGFLALRRILRCNPFHRQKSIEYDPVP